MESHGRLTETWVAALDKRHPWLIQPLTRFLSCTDPIDDFDSLSHHQKRHAETYVTVLIAATTRRSTVSLGT